MKKQTPVTLEMIHDLVKETETSLFKRIQQVIQKEAKATADNFNLLINHQITTESDVADLKERVSRIEKNMVTKADLSEMVAELRASREEQIVGAEQVRRVTDENRIHERRLRVLEKKAGIATSSFSLA